MESVISIVGFGNIGKLICALLLPYKEHRFIINIIDNDPDIRGAVIDFEHGAQLYPNHNITCNSDEHWRNSDFIFHCAGASVPVGESRLYTTSQSITITEAIFSGFKPTKNPFIIVIANPVEIISKVTQSITGLPPSNIIGTGTLLDSLRMNYIVSSAHLELTNIDAILLGEHGKTTFLSHELSRINGLPFNEVIDNEKIETYMGLVKSSAEIIKATQEATIYGVSYCAINIFEALLSETRVNKPVSAALPENLQKELGCPDLFLSLYSKINNHGAIPVGSYLPNDTELSCLKKSADLILSSIPANYV